MILTAYEATCTNKVDSSKTYQRTPNKNFLMILIEAIAKRSAPGKEVS